jgi:hypothetical protein
MRLIKLCIACVVTAQIRHGAATALREVVKQHGDTAGISAYTPEPNVSIPSYSIEILHVM